MQPVTMNPKKLKAQATFYLAYLTTTVAYIADPSGHATNRVATPRENFHPGGWRDQCAFMCDAVLRLLDPGLTWSEDVDPTNDLYESLGYVKGCLVACNVFDLATIAGHGDITEYTPPEERTHERGDAETGSEAEHAPGHRHGAD